VASPQRTRDILRALRNGTVPQRGLDLLAVGLERFDEVVSADLDAVAKGGAQFKAVRGEYGSGKTFFSRWLEDRARQRGFITTEVQVSETETPLHKLQTVYRRLIERLSVEAGQEGAFRGLIDAWFFALEEDVLAEGTVAESDTEALVERTNTLMEQRLVTITRAAPSFSAALRGYRKALVEERPDVAEGLLGWLGGQPTIGQAVKRYAGVKGDIDHDTALTFLQGLLIMLRDAGHGGLLLILDEVETIQRVRRNDRDKGLNGLRQLMDEVDGGRFPGLYVAITGTPAFFDGPEGVQRLPPLAQRLHTDFATEARFDNPRAPQLRLTGFDRTRLLAVGRKVRDLFADMSSNGDRIRTLCDDDYLDDLAGAVTGALGGKVGIAPRVFLKKLVADVLDRVDQFPEFDPRQHYALTVDEGELTKVERNARAASSPDDVELDL
jgi:hypothetical protein